MASRPYRLRLILDVELTEAEWALVSQAHLPDPSPERALARLVYDKDLDPALPHRLRGSAVSAALEVTAARLVIQDAKRFEDQEL